MPSDSILPISIYLLKVNNRNTRTRCEICSKITRKTPKRRHWRRSGVFIVNSEHISPLVPVFLLLTLNMYSLAGLIRSFDILFWYNHSSSQLPVESHSFQDNVRFLYSWKHQKISDFLRLSEDTERKHY